MNLENEFVLHRVGENLEFLQFKRLLKYNDILTHAYTLRNESIYYGPHLSQEEYYQNYKTLCQELNLEVANIIKPNQEHTSIVKIIQKKETTTPEFNPNYLQQTDGLITNQPNIILATTNADCILFLLFDPIQKVIANVHSGWRGTYQEIIVSTIKEMQANYQSKPQDIICCIAPSIHKCHFEVGEDVKNLFYEKFNYLPNIDKIIEKKGKKYYIDTILLNKTLLQNLGLIEENIIDSNICSVCHSDKINSYRFDKTNYKLSTAIITLK